MVAPMPAVTSTPPAAMPPVTGDNVTGRDTDQDEFLKRYRTVLDDRQKHERDPNTVDTQRLLDMSGSGIKNRATARKTALSADLARRGVGGTGVAAQLERGVDNDAQRAQAGAAADIVLGQQREQDQMDLARTGQTNALLSGGAEAFSGPARLALARQGLGIQQMGLQQSGDLGRATLEGQERDRELQRYLALQRSMQNMFPSMV